MKKLSEIMSKEELEEFAKCLQAVAEKSEEEQAVFLDRVYDEIDKLGTEDSILNRRGT